MLTARVTPFDAGSADHCCYDLHIDNTANLDMEMSEIALNLGEGTIFTDAVGQEWTISSEDLRNYRRWRSNSTSTIIPAHGSVHVGRFCIDYTSGNRIATAYLYQNGFTGEGSHSCAQEAAVGCAMISESCGDYLHADLTRQEAGEITGTHCFGIKIHQERTIDCEVAGITLHNATPDIAAEWNIGDFATPIDFGPSGREIGTLCFDPANPPSIHLTYWDNDGNVLHTEQLPVNGSIEQNPDNTTSGVELPGDILSALRIAPNPARENTTITYTLRRAGVVTIELFDLTGELVDLVSSEALSAGTYSFHYRTAGFPAGTYRLRLTSDGHVALAPVIIVR
jgi:hypothetical protein